MADTHMNIHAVTKLPGEHLIKARILVLTTSYPTHEADPSGVFIAKLLQAIRKRGYSIGVLAPSDGTFRGKRSLEGIETTRFGYFWPRSLERLTRSGGGIPENLRGSLLAKIQLLPMMLVFLLRGIRQALHSDVIYANWLGAGIVGAATSILTRKPLVVSFRGDDGYLARDRWVWRVLARWVIGRAATIAPVSRELLEIIRELGVPERKCHLPRFGVDTGMFYPSKRPAITGKEVRLLFVGSLIERKGLHDLLQALSDPALAGVRLLVVGEGIQGPLLMELSEKLGLSKRTQWLGVQSPVAVAQLMRSVDLLSLPSYMEGRPNVVNEAMASGLPVVATRIGGIPDMVREGETAYLFEPGNIEELRQCLLTLVRDADLRRRMGRAGHALLIQTGVSWDATAAEFDNIFAKTLEGQKT